jgi:hypothetical protein
MLQGDAPCRHEQRGRQVTERRGLGILVEA